MRISRVEAAAQFIQEAAKGEIKKGTREAAFTAAGSLPKELALMEWQRIPENQDVLSQMPVLPPKQAGSQYGSGGIRVEGPPEFVDAVLSRLKDLLDGENGRTRLGFSRSKVRPKTIQGQTKGFENAAIDAECVYIRLHERGIESQMAHAWVEGCKKLSEPCKYTDPLFE